MPHVRPLRVLIGFLVVYVAFTILSIPFLLLNAVWLGAASDAGAPVPVPSAAYIALFVGSRCLVNFAAGYFAHPLLKRWLRPAETLVSVLIVALAFAGVMAAGMFAGQLSALTVLGILSFVALGLGAVVRFRKSPSAEAAA